MWWFCCCAAAPLHFERSLWSRLGMCRKGAGRGQGAHGLCQHRPNIMHFYVAWGGMEYGVPCGPQPPSPPMSHCSHPSGLDLPRARARQSSCTPTPHESTASSGLSARAV